MERTVELVEKAELAAQRGWRMEDGAWTEAITRSFSGCWAVFSWEIRSFFLRPVSYVLLLAAAITAGWSFSWLVTLLSRGQTTGLRPADDPTSQFLGPNLFLIGGSTLLIPLLSMNAIAEERRRSTWEQLLTAPVSPPAVVIGKFAASWCVWMMCLIPWLFYIVVLRAWNGRFTTVWGGMPWFDGPGLQFDLGSVYGGIAALALVGGTFIAVGLFCSGLCRGSVSAALLSLATMGLFLLLGLAPRVLGHWGFSADQVQLVEAVSCWGHVERFSRGVIEPRVVAGHITVASVMLWATAYTCRRIDQE
jgi:ABC-2 type transport system permease protein